MFTKSYFNPTPTKAATVARNYLQKCRDIFVPGKHTSPVINMILGFSKIFILKRSGVNEEKFCKICKTEINWDIKVNLEASINFVKNNAKTSFI